MVHFHPSFLTNMSKRLSSKPPKAKSRQGNTSKMDVEDADLPGPTVRSTGLPGVVVDEKSGPCTAQLKGGKTCSCQRYSEANPRDSKNPGCRECTHGHSTHNGRRPNGDTVDSLVRNLLNKSKHNQDNRGQIAVPFKAAQHESNLGYRKVNSSTSMNKGII